MNEDNYALKEDESSLDEHCEHVQDIPEDKKAKEAILKGEKEISALLKASRAVLQYSDFKTSSKAIFDACTELIGAPAGYVALLTPDGKENQVVFLNTGEYICTVDPELSMPIRGMRGEVVKSKKPLYNNNFPETDWLRFMPKGHGYLENVLFTPLLIDDEVQGLMGMANKPGGFTEEDAKLAMTFTEFVSIALQNSQMLESLEDSEQKYKNLNQELEQKVIERTKKLKESEEKYRSLFENSPVALMDQDFSETKKYVDHLKATGINDFNKYFDGNPDELLKIMVKPKIIDVNKKTLEVYKAKSKEDFMLRMHQLSEKIGKSMSEEVFLYNKMQMLSMINGETEYETEIKTKTFTGDIIYIYAKTSIISGFENTWSNVIVSILDITDQKLMEENLKESEEKYRTLSDFSMVGISIIQDMQFKYVNQNLADDLGYTVEELLNMKSNELYPKIIHPEDLEDAINISKKNQAGEGDTTTIEVLHCVKKNGDSIWLEVFSRSIQFEGRPAGMNSSIDITERKKAEQELKESEEKFRNFTEQSLMGVAIIQDSVVKYASKRLADMYGYSVEEVLNFEPDGFLKLFDSEFLEIVKEQATKKQLGQKDVITNYEIKCVKKTGEKFWVENYSKTINYKGKPADFVTNIDITERKKTEQLLKESEEKFSKAFHSSPNLMAITRMGDGYFIEVNDTYIQTLGYSREELIGHTSVKLNLWANPKQRSEFTKRLTEDKKVKSFDVDVYTKSGKILTILFSGDIIYLNNIPHLITSANDITEYRIAEQKVKESEEKYRSLFENMNTGFAYHEVLVNDDNKPIDYRYIEANSQFEKLTGLKVSDIIGKTVTEVIPGIENDAADWIGKYGNVALTGEPLNAEDYSEALDRWYNVLGYSPKKRFFAVTFSDITDRKRAEKKLKESEEKYRHLYETSPYFIGLLDNKGILVDCNSSIYKFLSTHIKEDLIGKHFSKIFLLIERNEYLIPLFEKVFKDAINGKNTGPIDFQLYRSSGGYFWLNVQGSLIDLENQKLVQFFIQDISERKKAELIIQNEIAKLRELDQLKNEFIIRTSHELNTPLVSICGSVEFLLNYIKEDFSKQSRAHLETINSGGKRLKQLVENLFDILRIESRKFELDVENISLGNIIKKCISDLNYLAKEREITISTSIQHEFYVKVDEVKIEQVFVNLLSNALKNTPHYGQISISSEEAQGYINTNITDTGTGFTEDEKTRIFEKFGKIEKYGKGMDIITEGPGLGLYLSKKIVELHGGKIWLESEGRNKGSTFIVSLPIDEK